MKYITAILACAMLVSASSFAAKQITREESSGYTKIGDLSIEQSATPTVGNKALSKAANKKCKEVGDVKSSHCYYLIVDKTGNEADHKNIDLEIFKK